MKTLEEHRGYILMFVDPDDVEACIVQLKHAISISARAVVSDDEDEDWIKKMRHELELESQLLCEYENKRKGIR